jgi:hypothetical protein
LQQQRLSVTQEFAGLFSIARDLTGEFGYPVPCASSGENKVRQEEAE